MSLPLYGIIPIRSARPRSGRSEPRPGAMEIILCFIMPGNRKQIRLKKYDYSQEGVYFVTICSKDRKNIFSKIVVGEGLAPSLVELTSIGKIIDRQWRGINFEYKNIEIDKFIIMPNHIHGIVLIKRAGARPAPTLNEIIGSFKSKCITEYLKFIKDKDLKISGRIWQRSFFDHIIREDKSLREIRKYIVNNPANWHLDEYNIK